MIMHRRAGNINFSFRSLALILSISGSVGIQAQSRPWSVPEPARVQKNPESGNAGSLSEGKAIYSAYCTPCHGSKGRGDGDAAVALHPKPANHTALAIKKETDGALFYKISEGRDMMPRYKSSFSEKQRWALVCYIRTLSKKEKK
jgi:mono/diheme cytochrome c family protein